KRVRRWFSLISSIEICSVDQRDSTNDSWAPVAQAVRTIKLGDRLAVIGFWPGRSRHKQFVPQSRRLAETSDRPLSRARQQTARLPTVGHLSARFGGPHTPILPCRKRPPPHFPCRPHAARLRQARHAVCWLD